MARHPSGIVVSNADCFAVVSGFESLRRHGKERWEASGHLQGVLSQNWGETEVNHSVTCMVLKATANGRHHLTLCHGELRGP
ncbi:hypothetical protein TNCV_2359091 [Trichonephila clavipes]|nr:hypothetical protein TNCV_2359091 [Trichonephila clavipes]